MRNLKNMMADGIVWWNAAPLHPLTVDDIVDFEFDGEQMQLT